MQFSMSQYATTEDLYKAKAEHFEQIAADRLEYIRALGADLSQSQIANGELQAENARLRRIEEGVKAYSEAMKSRIGMVA